MNYRTIFDNINVGGVLRIWTRSEMAEIIDISGNRIKVDYELACNVKNNGGYTVKKWDFIAGYFEIAR